MAFEGFDLGLKDKYNNSLCVGDFIRYNKLEYKGQIVYSPKLYAFSMIWENDDDIYPLHIYTGNFWEEVEKCAKP